MEILKGCPEGVPRVIWFKVLGITSFSILAQALATRCGRDSQDVQLFYGEQSLELEKCLRDIGINGDAQLTCVLVEKVRFQPHGPSGPAPRCALVPTAPS